MQIRKTYLLVNVPTSKPERAENHSTDRNYQKNSVKNVHEKNQRFYCKKDVEGVISLSHKLSAMVPKY